MPKSKKAIGRRPYTVNQKFQVFQDSRLKRGAGQDKWAIADQLDDTDVPNSFRPCAYCGRKTRVPDYTHGDWVAPMVYPHSVRRFHPETLKVSPFLIPHCVHAFLAKQRRGRAA